MNKFDDLNNLFFQDVKVDTEKDPETKSNETTTHFSDEITEATNEVPKNTTVTEQNEVDAVQDTVDSANDTFKSAQDTLDTTQDTVDTVQDTFDNNKITDTSKEAFTIDNTSKQKKRSLLFPIIGAGAVLVAAIVCIVIVLNKSKNDDLQVANVDSYLSELFATSNPIEKAIGTDKIIQSFLSESSQIDGNLNTALVYGSPEASGINYDYSIKRNLKEKLASLETNIKYRNANILSSTLYADKDNVKLKIPAISEGVFQIKTDKLYKQIKASPLYKENEDTAQFSQLVSMIGDIDLEKIFDDYSKYCDNTEILTTVIKKIQKNYPDDYDTIISGITYGALENDSNNNKGTRVTISSKSVALFVQKLLTVWIDDKETCDYLSVYLKNLYTLNYVNDDEYESYDEFKEDTLNKLKSQLTSIGSVFAMYYGTDIVMDVYKNPAGQLVSLTSKNSIDINGQIIGLNFFISSRGNDMPANNMTFSLDIVIDNQVLNLSFSNITSSSTDILKNIKSLSISASDSDSITIKLSENYNTKTNEYNLALDFDVSDDNNLSIQIDGIIKELVKGTSFTLDIDSLDVSANDEPYIILNGSFSVGPLKDNILEPSGTPYKILEMSEDELKKLAGEIENNMNSFGNTLESMGIQ